jgi:ubiquinone/menaquinone biosynthesis C-methylase UbiE
MEPSDAYVLRRRDAEEIARLGLQHQVWQEPTRRALDDAGFAPGDAVADLGCGPGYLTLELAERVGPSGRVLGIDSSPRFIRTLQARATQAGAAQVEAILGDVRDQVAAAASLDGAICRWTLMFVPEPQRVLAQVAAALRPGGTFLVMEYSEFLSMALHPVGSAFARTYGAVHQLIASAGGDASLGDRLPSMVVDAGLDVVDVHTVRREGRPGDPMWRWLEATHRNHGNLVEAGLLSAAELGEYYREWGHASVGEDAYFTAPPLRVVMARKR